MDKFSRVSRPVSSIDGIACPTDDPMLMPMEHLEARICELAGHLAAATCRYLLLVADFDAREGWRAWEMPSCAAWLAWKCQVAPGTAKDQVRVARALKELPVIRGEFAAGRFSYSKVRALARIATPQTEQGLVDMAQHMTAGQVERFAQAHRRVSKGQGEPPSPQRKLTWRIAEDGTITFTAALPPEDGAVILQALRASRDDLEHPHEGERVPVEDLADALTDVCASYLQAKVAYWSNGGQTAQDNLLCLCRRHHRVVHDRGYIISAGGQFHTRDGTLIPHSPPLRPGSGDITGSHDATIAYHTIVPPYSGERLNLHDAIFICFANAENAERRQQLQAA